MNDAVTGFNFLQEQDPLVGELRMKCLAAIQSLSEAAQHPLSARREALQGLRDAQHVYALAEQLDPEES